MVLQCACANFATQRPQADCGLTRRWTERVLTARHRWCLWSEFRTTSPTSNRRLSFHHVSTIYKVSPCFSCFSFYMPTTCQQMPTDCFNSAFLFFAVSKFDLSKNRKRLCECRIRCSRVGQAKDPKDPWWTAYPDGNLTYSYWKMTIYSGFTHWKWWIFP